LVGIASAGVPEETEDALDTVQHQAAARFLNERAALVYDDAAEWLRLLCECGRNECDTLIEIRRGEYDAVRSDGRCFLVAPDHGVDAIESPILHCGRFDLVRAKGAAADLASALASRPDVDPPRR
jgi:hypothetical protein